MDSNTIFLEFPPQNRVLYTPHMDPTVINPTILAQQLLKPEGELGEKIGEFLVERNASGMTFTFEHLYLKPSDHVLEIGFGPGEAIAEAVKQTPQGFVAGIDFSDVMLRMAEKRNHEAIADGHVALTLGDASRLPYKDNTFDVVFAMNVFHFWQEPLRELAECRRVLKTNGRILFYFNHHSSWMDGLGDTGVFIAYEPSDVEKILTEAGFHDVGSLMGAVEKDGKCFLGWGVK